MQHSKLGQYLKKKSLTQKWLAIELKYSPVYSFRSEKSLYLRIHNICKGVFIGNFSDAEKAEIHMVLSKLNPELKLSEIF